MLTRVAPVRVLAGLCALTVAGTLVTSVGAASPGAAAPVAATRSSSTADPEQGPLIAGETSYVRGAHVWTDYAYDDRGADTDEIPGGDAAYPAAPHPGNTADLIQLQLDTDRRGRLTVGAVLGTLVPGHEVMVGVAFDTDRDTTTGVPTPDFLDWLPQGALGLDTMILLGSDGRGQVLRGTSTGWERVRDLTVRVDRALNSLGATARGLRPQGATWNAVGVAGRLEDGRSWFDSDLPIQDLAYVRGEDPPGQVLLSVPASLPPDALQPFGDHIQADVLAGDRPSSLAVTPVTFGTRRTSLARVRQGYNAFLYHSRITTPEGIARGPRVFQGVYQPYGVWVPENLPARPPMVVFLHGADQYHTVNVAYFNNPDSIGIPSPYDVPAVTIFPNGRTTTWGTPLSDRDALDAIADAVSRLGIDERRIVVSGVSSGGYGTYHLASRFPDRFTGAYSLVGGTGLGGGAPAVVENLTNVPFRASNGLLDPLVNVRTWRASADALAASGPVDYRIVLVHNRSHDGPLAEGNCYLRDLLSRDVVRRPGLIRFTTPAHRPQALALGVQPTSAYWLDRIRLRDTEAAGTVRAQSKARPGRAIVEDGIFEVGENASRGADFCGDNPAMRNGNNWDIEGRRTADAPFTRRNKVALTLENLAKVRLDARQAGIRPGRRLAIRITSDGPAKVRIPAYRTTIKVLAGTRTYKVRPRR